MTSLASSLTDISARLRFFAGLFLASMLVPAHGATPPAVGDAAPDFKLQTLDGGNVQLKSLTAKQPVVLVVLRGWPGYQCPACARQARDFIVHAPEFAKRGVQVLMVYPGPAEQLQAHAREFLDSKEWPREFLLALDPGYAFTNAYGLRWDAPKETAYPATFLINRNGNVGFALVSKSHGGRTTAAQVLAELK